MKRPLVSVVLATYNGERFLQQQLDSIYNQTYPNLEVIVCDDLSTDGTIHILERYKQHKGLSYYVNPQRLGVIKNFERAISLATGEYIALSDQDDLWLPHKLEKSLAKIQYIEKTTSPHRPILVHTDLYITDDKGNVISDSYWKHAKLSPACSLNRLLLENSITGCTIFMNKLLAQISLPIPDKVLMHDVWLGLVASSFGEVAFINEPTVYYRQHTTNVLGAKQLGITNRLLNTLRTTLKDSYRKQYLQENIEQARAFKEQYGHLLDQHQLRVLESFINFKSQNFFSRRLTFLKYGLLKYNTVRNFNMMIKL